MSLFMPLDNQFILSILLTKCKCVREHYLSGHKIDGLLCDGPSNHDVASTVVNCMKIDQGKIFEIIK